MNGIYIHIPFCKKVCYYCDFHFTVSLKHKDRLVKAIAHELDMRRDFLGEAPIDTIYFGGGTPSVLEFEEIKRILDQVKSNYNVSGNAEITFEANPDDITQPYLSQLNQLGINRLSIGIQSFFDDDLKWMNRRHTGLEAENSIKLSQQMGFQNINIDLIYGLPNLSTSRWIENLERFSELNIPHLSAYHLTIEPKTVFGYYKKKGKLVEIDEEKSVEHYTTLIEAMHRFGYQHYEISNFCRDGSYSKHNLNYWKQGRYLGVGPSAHSYNGDVRQWNVSVNTPYMEAVEQNKPCYEKEILSEGDKFNDYVLTGLRTIWGIDKDKIKTIFGEKFLSHLDRELLKLGTSDLLQISDNRISLTEKGMFVSDKIISQLFWT